MAGLLISVRSAAEALAAWAGRADLIDVKEPLRGPLGMADPPVWRAVVQAVGRLAPVSVALGELADWVDRPPIERACFEGIIYRKLGLAGAAAPGEPAWQEQFSALLQRFGPGPAWIAVAYADWRCAAAPSPSAVLRFAHDARCAGVLLDTWSKGPSAWLGPSWGPWVAAAQGRGLLVALAGGLNAQRIAQLGHLAPDWFAARGAACAGSDRCALIQAQRVAALKRLLGHQGKSRSRLFSGTT